MQEILHVLFNIFSPDNAIPECVQRNFCPLPPLAMTSITTTYRQRNVHLFDSTLEVRDCLAYLHAGDQARQTHVVPHFTSDFGGYQLMIMGLGICV